MGLIPRLVCGISGGVDSAVAALLLKRKGYEVIGAYMVNWDIRDEYGKCQADEDYHYAIKACQILDIPLHRVEFIKEYWTDVFQYTLNTYENGRTPNPDILCNKYVKFQAFHDYALKKHNCQFVATGHYARTNFGDRFLNDPALLGDKIFEAKLLRAVDETKDQSLFLHQISNTALRRSIFPLGEIKKYSVKEIARKNDLEFLANKKESMGICFIGSRKFQSFIADYIPQKEGNFRLLHNGKIVGTHTGIFKYTIGQNSKLALDYRKYYIADKDIDANDMYLVTSRHHRQFYSCSLIVRDIHWITKCPPVFSLQSKFRCKFRFMHLAPLKDCTLYKLSENECLVVFDIPVRCLTKGQFAVFYDDLQCLGGSPIMSIGPSSYETCADNKQFKPIPSRKDTEQWLQIIDKFGPSLILRNRYIKEPENMPNIKHFKSNKEENLKPLSFLSSIFNRAKLLFNIR